MLETDFYRCPYCGETVETTVDISGGDQVCTEDCQVCCRPIEFGIERDEAGALLGVSVRRLD